MTHPMTASLVSVYPDVPFQKLSCEHRASEGPATRRSTRRDIAFPIGSSASGAGPAVGRRGLAAAVGVPVDDGEPSHGHPSILFDARFFMSAP